MSPDGPPAGGNTYAPAYARRYDPLVWLALVNVKGTVVLSIEPGGAKSVTVQPAV